MKVNSLKCGKEEVKMNNTINIVAQAFYGNKVGTSIKIENMDSFILGNLDGINSDYEKVDRTIVKIPNTDNLVIVYNKYFEENERKRKEDLFKNDNYILKPTATIPEINLELYSRCIVCRVNDNGEFESLRDGDFKKFEQYLAD
jgi:hypothetical protein